MIWEDCYRLALKDMGFVSGIASQCSFNHRTRGLSVVVNGDDFKCMGLDSDLDLYEAELSNVLEIEMRGRLEEGCTMTEITMLNRAVRVTADGLEYEDDPRHFELSAGSMNMTAADSVKKPGVKEPIPD